MDPLGYNSVRALQGAKRFQEGPFKSSFKCLLSLAAGTECSLRADASRLGLGCRVDTPRWGRLKKKPLHSEEGGLKVALILVQERELGVTRKPQP